MTLSFFAESCGTALRDPQPEVYARAPSVLERIDGLSPEVFFLSAALLFLAVVITERLLAHRGQQ